MQTIKFLTILEYLKWVGLFTLVIAKGFGNAFLMKIGVAIPLGFLLVNSFQAKKYKEVLFALTLAGIAYLEWPLVNLWGFWALVVYVCLGSDHKFSFGLTSCFLFLWLLQETEIGSWSALPYFAIPLFVLTLFLGTKLKKIILYPLLFACIIYTAFDISFLVLNNPVIQVSQNSQLAKGYSPGPLLAKILHGEVVTPGNFSGDIGISSLIFDKGPFKSSKYHILLAEHDLDYHDENLIPENAQQKEPWVFNQMFGNQYLLEAIARDGAWMGNLGGSLNPSGKLMLGSFSHFGKQNFTPLVIKHRNVIYVQDSDSFVDRVASRQVNTVKEITLGRITCRVINIIFCLLILLPFNTYGFMCRILAPLILIAWLQIPIRGDVRIVADIDWPHEPSKASGVLASLTDSGLYFLKGDTATQLLIVGQRNSTIVMPSEKLIVLEPEATVYLNKHKIRADKLPLGQKAHITDSRMLYVDDYPIGVTVEIDGHTIIGSGSPAKTEWKKWLISSH